MSGRKIDPRREIPTISTNFYLGIEIPFNLVEFLIMQILISDVFLNISLSRHVVDKIKHKSDFTNPPKSMLVCLLNILIALIFNWSSINFRLILKYFR